MEVLEPQVGMSDLRNLFAGVRGLGGFRAWGFVAIGFWEVLKAPGGGLGGGGGGVFRTERVELL